MSTMGGVAESVRFREVLSRFPTGVVAVTAWSDEMDSPLGMTIGSFMSVSLDPPLVAFGVAETSSTWPHIRPLGRFAVNILGDDDGHICAKFGRKGADRFTDIEWHLSPNGTPILDRAIGWIDCEFETLHTVGDHELVVGRVTDLDVGRDGSPLIFAGKAFGSFSQLPQGV